MGNDGFWSIILLLVALLIIAIEFFVPSGGFLAICAAVAGVASLILAFKEGIEFGFTMVVATLFAVPLTFLGMIKLLPFTPMGRRMLSPPPPPAPDPVAEAMLGLVGKLGVTKTELMPAGFVEIEGHRYDAIAPGLVVPAGQVIEVVKFSGGTLHVVPSDQPLPSKNPAAQTSLGTSLKDLGLEELDRPLG